MVLDLFSLDPGGRLVSTSPIDGKPIGRVTVGDPDLACGRAAEAFLAWRQVPGPRRGELVRLLGGLLREAKPVLAKMITLEAGKIMQESLGEVQEMIDICDFAVGLSRQLYGLTIASERPDHRMIEQWHPLGPVLVISAFNFPVAVWAWNAALALVCGDPVIWKPSEKTPLCAELVMQLVRRAIRDFGEAPDGLIQLVQGERDIGEALVDACTVWAVLRERGRACGRAHHTTLPTRKRADRARLAIDRGDQRCWRECRKPMGRNRNALAIRRPRPDLASVRTGGQAGRQ